MLFRDLNLGNMKKRLIFLTNDILFIKICFSDGLKFYIDIQSNNLHMLRLSYMKSKKCDLMFLYHSQEEIVKENELPFLILCSANLEKTLLKLFLFSIS